MATFTQRIAFAADATISNRIQVAVIMTALAVAAEPRPTADTTADDRSRMNVLRSFARSVLLDPAAAAPRLRWVLAGTDLVDVATPTDGDFLERVAAVWDALAGA